MFGFLDGEDFVAGRSKRGKKVLNIPPTPLKKCGEKVLRVRTKGTPDTHNNNNKTASCDTGGLAAVVDQQALVSTNLFIQCDNSGTRWELWAWFKTDRTETANKGIQQEVYVSKKTLPSLYIVVLPNTSQNCTAITLWSSMWCDVCQTHHLNKVFSETVVNPNKTSWFIHGSFIHLVLV